MSKYLIARLPISIMCAIVNRKGGRNCNFIVLGWHEVQSWEKKKFGDLNSMAKLTMKKMLKTL